MSNSTSNNFDLLSGSKLNSDYLESQNERTISKKKRTRGYAKVKVIGVGGGGCNVINTMIDYGLMGVEFWVCNTDMQALEHSACDNRTIIGYETTKGLGAGANPEVGEAAAVESTEDLKNIIKGSDMIFIASGMGGGTGTGAAHIIAKIAQDLNILTIACVTKPFNFEGRIRMQNAEDGIAMLRKHVDSMIIISNERLIEVIGDISFKEAFIESDKILLQAVQAITDLISIPAQINLDFADIRTIMEKKGVAMIGVGQGDGDNRAEDAAKSAISWSLLDMKIAGAKNALVNITSSTVTLKEVNTIIEIIKNAANSDIDVIYGMALNKTMNDEIVVTVIATGFDQQNLNWYDEQTQKFTDENTLNTQQNNADDSNENFTEEGAPLVWTMEQKKLLRQETDSGELLLQKQERYRREQFRKKQVEQQYNEIRDEHFLQNRDTTGTKNVFTNNSFTNQINIQQAKIQQDRERSSWKWATNKRKSKSRKEYEQRAMEQAEQSIKEDNTDELPSFMNRISSKKTGF